MKRNLLDLETRQKIFQLICRNPGLHLRELERQLKMSSPLILYHLRFLERYEIITSMRQEKYKRYYPSQFENKCDNIDNSIKSELSYSDKKILGLLREKIPLGIVLFILTSEGAVEHKTLYKNLEIPKSTLTYHLKKLIRLGVLENIEFDGVRGYDIPDRNKITKLLITYKPTQDMIYEYGTMWTELFGDDD